MLGDSWHNGQTNGVAFAVPVRPCDEDSRGCKDFGGYGDKKQSELESPEFNDRLDFIREAKIDRAGCFVYSDVTGAEANNLPGMLLLQEREARRARFMAVAEEVSTRKLQERVGATMQVLVDSAPGLGRKGGVGRSYADAPEIDGLVHIQNADQVPLRVGEFVDVEITESDEHDLFGDAIVAATGRPLDVKVL